MNKLNGFIEDKTGVKSAGKYNERNVYSMSDSPKNKEESDDYANALSNGGHYPVGLNGCFTVGISGGCSPNCWVFQKGDCEEPVEGFINMEDAELLALYDDGYYEEEIAEYLKSNNKTELLENRYKEAKKCLL